MYSSTATSNWIPGQWYVEMYQPVYGWVCNGSYCWCTVTGGVWRWLYLQGQPYV